MIVNYSIKLLQGSDLRKKEGKDWGYVILPVVYDGNTNEIDKHSTALKQIALTQTNDQKNITNIKNQSQKLSDSVVELSQLSQNNLEVQNKIDELSKSFLLLEETVQAFDSYRRQNNEMLQEMQLEISSINMSNTP